MWYAGHLGSFDEYVGNRLKVVDLKPFHVTRWIEEQYNGTGDNYRHGAIRSVQFTLAYPRGWAANSPNSRIRLKAELVGTLLTTESVRAFTATSIRPSGARFYRQKALPVWVETRRTNTGLGNRIPTLLEEFARIQSTDIVLPVRDGRSVRLRCIVRPDRAQSIQLDHLGIILPERLKTPKGMHKCSANFS